MKSSLHSILRMYAIKVSREIAVPVVEYNSYDGIFGVAALTQDFYSIMVYLSHGSMVEHNEPSMSTL